MIGFWDVVLILAVTVQVAVLAYIFDPRWKAFILVLPIPFTIATLALAQPVDATHVFGLVLLLLFTNAVRVLHYELFLPIIPSIVLAAAGYCAIGWAVASYLPTSETTFWLSAVATLIVALVARRLIPSRKERGYKSSAPLWIKLPAIVAVVLFLVLIKHGLRGFATVFPMVGLIGAYEARKTLSTVARTIPTAMLMLLLLMIVSHTTCRLVGLEISLAIGWGVFLGALILVGRISLFPREDLQVELTPSIRHGGGVDPAHLSTLGYVGKMSMDADQHTVHSPKTQSGTKKKARTTALLAFFVVSCSWHVTSSPGVQAAGRVVRFQAEIDADSKGLEIVSDAT